MKKIFITLFVLFSFNSFAFPQPDKPKLVVGIVIDQMNYDYFGRYMHKFCEAVSRDFITTDSISKIPISRISLPILLPGILRFIQEPFPLITALSGITGLKGFRNPLCIAPPIKLLRVSVLLPKKV